MRVETATKSIATNLLATRILLVEDNYDHAALLRTILTGDNQRQLAVKHAARLQEALEYLAGEEVDVILLDLGLPDSSGLQGLERVHELVPGAPVIIMTAMEDEATASAAIQKGAQDYLIKGLLDRTQLDRAIRYAIERNRAVKELDILTNQLRETNARLQSLALLDPLTKLLNRRGLQEALSREIQWADRHRTETIALFVDLDDFKRINDTLGYAVGDLVLKEVAERMKAGMRRTDYVARIGGDEFVILLPQTALSDGREIGEKLRLAISETPSSLSLKAVRVTASVGVLPVSRTTPSIDELLSQMHFVLSQSKQAGKNRVSGHWQDDSVAEGDGGCLPAIAENLLRGEALRVVTQPIVRLTDETIVGYEFLSRFSSEAFEAPADFFRICLESNILTLVDQRCFKNCLAAATRVPGELRRYLNLFPSTMVARPVEHLLESFPPDRLPGTYCIEISEQQIIGAPLNLVDVVTALKHAGILIACDDVGCGHSSLESLTLLNPDIVKIDKRCVAGIAEVPSRLHALRRLLKIIDALGADVVAEGIESRNDLDVLKDLGVPHGQGFLWGALA
jgi:diguanylate cyclase (GGDEF)-like protein